ncbi:MAG: hypothetical protein GY815_15205 [Gammaproteobacteria bacterium]|nr:hypothetical protein [Gammaproteobacteria bacterium]
MFKIESIGSGFIAIMAHPGQEQNAASTLAAVARGGIRQVVSLLEPAEARVLGLDAEAHLVAAESMAFVSFPIPDMGLPASHATCIDRSTQASIHWCIAAGASGARVCWLPRCYCIAAWIRGRPANGSPAYAGCASLKLPNKGPGCRRIIRRSPT